MLIRHFSLITLLTIIGFVSQASNNSLLFFNGSLEDIQLKALELNQPYFVYFYNRNERVCKKMKRKTWKDPVTKSVIDDHFLALQYDVLSTNHHIDILQKYQVYHYPTILFFSPEGKLIGRTEGFLAPKTLQTIIHRHVQRIQKPVKPQKPVSAPIVQQSSPTPPSATAMLAHAAVTRSLPAHLTTPPAATSKVEITDINTDDMSKGMVMRGQSMTKIHIDVPMLEKYSLSNLILNDSLPQAYGLLMKSFTSYNKLKEELNRFEKIWKGQIWVYVEEVESIPVYKLALGSFADREKAEIFSNAIYKFGEGNATILDLGRLLK